MKTKLAASLSEAIERVGLVDGMTVSFHHHLRNGDRVVNLVLDAIAAMGIGNLTVNASSLFDAHLPLLDHARASVVSALETDYVSPAVGSAISAGAFFSPVLFRTHGGRAADLATGRAHIDVAFIAAPAADNMGNCSGKFGPSACGSLGYAFADAAYADRVVVLTDHLVPYPLMQFSIDETRVDCVVPVDSIGDPAGIVSGTTRITRDPVGLAIASLAARAIEASGLLTDGMSFQTGAGGASLAVARLLMDRMLEKKVRGSFGLGGITGYLVDMLNAGCFSTLLDVQCFDLTAVESIRVNPNHREISAMQYASSASASAAVDSLDAVILGATEIDTSFNVNVHTGHDGTIMGGSGGHGDAAAGAKLAIIVAPSMRARLPLVTERVQCVSTPGRHVDLLVTERGVAVNPARPELAKRLRDARLPVVGIREIKELTERVTGVPAPLVMDERAVGTVLDRDGEKLDVIYGKI